MIDVFGSGPYLSLTELLPAGIWEFAIFYLHFFFFLASVLMLKRLASGHIVSIAALLLPILQVIYVWSVSIKSEFLFSLSLAFLITAQVRVLNLLPMQALDYAFLFSAMLFPNRLFNSTSAILGNLWFFWIIFSVFYTTVKIGLHRIRGHHFVCYFLFVFLSLSMYTYSLSIFILHPAFTELMGSSAYAIICAVIIMTAFLLAVAFFINARFHSQLIKLNHLGEKYGNIERYFLGFSVLILILFTIIFLPFSILQLHNALIVLLIPCLCLALLWAQMPFIILLFRVAVYKESATFHEWEKEGIASYYRELSGSLTALQEMRHDIKNIFFTMGNFVDHSDDLEMKKFFWEKIYPYSVETIRQSELLSILYQIPIESLRAFFNLKISQALGQKIPVSLKVNIIPETFQTGIDIIDLTRILGILLDNAIEEVRQIPKGTIEIKITGNNSGCSYIIKNSITEQTRVRGIYAGKTSKGAGRGNGLLIVQQLLEQYHNTTLNTSIQNLTYVQSINISMSYSHGTDRY